MYQGLAWMVGGLGVGWQAEREKSGLLSLWQPTSLDIIRICGWLLVVLLIAVMANPGETAFKSYLTELSFKKHLRDLHHPSGHRSGEEGGVAHAVASDTPSPTPFRFSNHVAITLRTPGYQYHNAFLFSMICIFPTTSKSSSKSSKGSHGKSTRSELPVMESETGDDVDPTLAGVWFLGAFGRWWSMGNIRKSIVWWLLMNLKQFEGVQSGEPGVLNMVALPDSNEGTSADAVIKVMDERDVSLPALKSSLDLENDDTPTLGPDASLPFHNNPKSDKLLPESNGHLSVPLSDKTSKDDHVPSITTTHDPPTPLPAVSELSANLVTAQSSVAELREQLDQLNSTVEQSHLQLQTAVEELRKKKKEEDAERADLKSKMKGLEENKRQAEGSRREAEKKLRAAETTRDAIQSRIQTMREEIEKMKQEKDESVQAVVDSREGRATRTREIAQSLAEKTTGLETVEGEVAEQAALNAELAAKVLKAVDVLQSLIEHSPQALMGSEMGEHQQSSNPITPDLGHHQGQPFIPQQQLYPSPFSYQDPGHQAPYQSRGYRDSPDFQPYSNNQQSNHYDHAPPSFRDLHGFEGFSPFVGRSHPDGYQDVNVRGNHLDVDEPGSPTGTMSSSFSTALLPQGLFTSLEGDATPMLYATGSDYMDALDDESDTSPDLDTVLPPKDKSLTEGEQPTSDVPAAFALDIESPASPPVKEPETTSLHHSSSVSKPLSTSPSRAGPRRWFSSSRLRGMQQGNSSADDLHAKEPLPAQFGIPLSQTISNDSLIGGPGLESAFAPSAAEKRALRWGTLSRFGANRQPEGSGELTGFMSAPYIGSPPASARSSSVDLTARTAWEHATVPTGKPAAGAEDKSPFRFLSSLGRRSAKESGVWGN